MSPQISRRDVLKSLTVGVMAGSVLSVIPVEAAEHAHGLIAAEKMAGAYTPKYFSAPQYKTLQALSQLIIPPEGEAIAFQSPPKLLRMLIEGTDEIGLTLGLSEQIEAFRKEDRERRPWAYLAARQAGPKAVDA